MARLGRMAQTASKVSLGCPASLDRKAFRDRPEQAL
jgi:hypothetical protein